MFYSHDLITSHSNFGPENKYYAAVLAIGVSTALLHGCSESLNDSNLSIAGGRITNDYEDVKLMLTNIDKQTVCTGTVVSDSTVLMAGHCVKDPAVQDGVYLEGGRIRSEKIHRWLALKNVEKLSDITAAQDLAVVVFPRGSFKPPFRALKQSLPRQGETVHLVGFGAEGFDTNQEAVRNSGSLKRTGRNSIHEVRAGLIFIKSQISQIDQDHAIAATGDSGGPMLDEQGKLLGIAAGLYLLNANHQATGFSTDKQGELMPNMEGAVAAVNAYVDLSSAAGQKFLGYAVSQGAVIPGIAANDVAPLAMEDSQHQEAYMKAINAAPNLSNLGPMIGTLVTQIISMVMQAVGKGK